MRVLSLFSGGGLGDYGLELAGMQIVGQVEIDDYCQKILNLRWPDVPKWKDIKTFNAKDYKGAVDLVSGGFPCQPFSVAGKRKGAEDSRDLWKEMFRVICEVRPRWVLAENVPGLLSISHGRKFGEVVRDLASVGYCVEWDCIPASAVGAPHRRDRVWIVANTESKRTVRESIEFCEKDGGQGGALFRKFIFSSEDVGYSEHDGQPASKIRRSNGKGNDYSQKGKKQAGEPQRSSESGNVAYAFINSEGSAHGGEIGKRQRGRKKQIFGKWDKMGGDIANSGWRWAAEPNVGRVAHGVASRVDRLKLLGNGQVVQVVEWIGKRIMEYESELKKGGA